MKLNYHYFCVHLTAYQDEIMLAKDHNADVRSDHMLEQQRDNRTLHQQEDARGREKAREIARGGRGTMGENRAHVPNSCAERLSLPLFLSCRGAAHCRSFAWRR